MDGDIRDSDHDDFDARHIALQEALRTAAKAVLEDRPEGYAFELSPFAVVTACTPGRINQRRGIRVHPSRQCGRIGARNGGAHPT